MIKSCFVEEVLNNPNKIAEAKEIVDRAHEETIEELGPIEGTEYLLDTIEGTVGIRGALAEFPSRIRFFDISQESWDALNSPEQVVTGEVKEAFDQVFAIDGAKIEGKELEFNDYLTNKARNEAVVAVFKDSAELERIADGYVKKTGMNLTEMVHIRVLGQGDLANIKEEQLLAMFNGIGAGPFTEVRLGTAIDEHKTVAIAVGKGV
jgi:hypothetical protein